MIYISRTRICIDPGHGSYDPGAVGQNGTLEKNINLQVSLKLANKFINNNFEVKLTRNSDITLWNKDQDLWMRCDISNNFNADIFISIHCNSSSNLNSHGTETYWSGQSQASGDIAKLVQNELILVNGLIDRGVKIANFYVLKKTSANAVLVELAFINNPTEEQLLNDGVFQNKCADAIFKGVCKYLGMREVINLFNDFNNVSDWAKDSVSKLENLKLINGDQNNNFNPKAAITREEFAVVINRLLGLFGK